MYERVIITIKTTYIISSVYQKLLKKKRIGRIWDKKLKILSGGTGASNKHGHMWRHLWRGFINSSTYDGSGGGDYDDDLDHGGKNEEHIISMQNYP